MQPAVGDLQERPQRRRQPVPDPRLGGGQALLVGTGEPQPPLSQSSCFVLAEMPHVLQHLGARPLLAPTPQETGPVVALIALAHARHARNTHRHPGFVHSWGTGKLPHHRTRLQHRQPQPFISVPPIGGSRRPELRSAQPQPERLLHEHPHHHASDGAQNTPTQRRPGTDPNP
ncbi:hypothetical protein ACU686_11860 [Yinghuangia aomiensis]